MGSQVHEMTVHEAAGLLASRQLSSEELVQLLLTRIRAVDGAINAYVSVDEAAALADARECDRRRAAGQTGRLLGVPIAVKDVLNVRGQSCTCASKILSGYVSPYDATAVARLREAGAVFVGRTNMDEFAMGSTNENSVYGPVRNPCSPDCVAGGSSGGSAAAVAAGSALAALGSDTGGSVRLPASFCGCVGLKPSYGRVSRYGLTAFASSLDQIGPLSRDVRDAALLLEIMAGWDPMDSTSVDRPVPAYSSLLKGDMKGLRIGIPREYFAGGMQAEVESAVRKAAAQCTAAGAELIEVSLPHTDYAIATYYILATAEASANLARFDGVRYGFRVSDAEDPMDLYGRTRAAGFGPEVKRRIILGTFVLSSGYHDAYYLTAQKVRTLIRRDFDNAFRSCDVLFTPVSPTPACRIGERMRDPLQMYLSDIFTVTANLAGVAGISVPCGHSADGLPIGLQILAPSFGDDRMLDVAYGYEQIRGPLRPATAAGIASGAGGGAS